MYSNCALHTTSFILLILIALHLQSDTLGLVKGPTSHMTWCNHLFSWLVYSFTRSVPLKAVQWNTALVVRHTTTEKPLAIKCKCQWNVQFNAIAWASTTSPMEYYAVHIAVSLHAHTSLQCIVSVGCCVAIMFIAFICSMCCVVSNLPRWTAVHYGHRLGKNSAWTCQYR